VRSQLRSRQEVEAAPGAVVFTVFDVDCSREKRRVDVAVNELGGNWRNFIQPRIELIEIAGDPPSGDKLADQIPVVAPNGAVERPGRVTVFVEPARGCGVEQ